MQAKSSSQTWHNSENATFDKTGKKFQKKVNFYQSNTNESRTKEEITLSYSKHVKIFFHKNQRYKTK